MLAHVRLAGVGPNQWHRIKLRFEGKTITALVDDKQVLSVTDALYSSGMAGLMAGREGGKLSMPYFDNVVINDVNAAGPVRLPDLPEEVPLYDATETDAGSRR